MSAKSGLSALAPLNRMQVLDSSFFERLKIAILKSLQAGALATRRCRPRQVLSSD